MRHGKSRRQFIRHSLGAAATLAVGRIPIATANGAEPMTPLIRRIRMATVGAPDVATLVEWYTTWLGYQVAEDGLVSPNVAASWGAPAMTGRRYVSLAPEGGGDVYIRAVEIDPVPEYRPMTTFGWNAIEIIIDDLEALNERMIESPFEIIGEPHSLGGGFASIHAMQVVGPAQEVLYLTTETGDREKSTLPIPRSFVDRPFIMILAGPDIDALENFYVEKFGMGAIPHFQSSITMISEALGLPDDHVFELGLLRGGERGNNIELDTYPAEAGPRIATEGQLPPGIAMTSFAVPNLDAIDIDFIQPPSALYGPRRAATFAGPAGELTELIEDSPLT